MFLLKKVLLIASIITIAFYLFTQDTYLTYSVIYGLSIAIIINIHSYRAIEKSLYKVYKGANYALASLMVGELLKFVVLVAMLYIGIKGLDLAAKEMVFSFICFYFINVILNSKQERE